MSRCGTKAEFEYKVSSELVGRTALFVVKRTSMKDPIGSLKIELKEEKATFKWPDQEKPDKTYFGGRKVEWNGLDKLEFKDKFKHQKFEVSISVPRTKAKSSSKNFEIKQYADKGPEKREVGFPMDIKQYQDKLDALGNVVLDAAGNVSKVPVDFPDSELQRKDWVSTNAGNFHIEFKEGQVIVTVKVGLFTNDPIKKIGPGVWKYFKKNVERFWNGRAGFRQWVFHLEGCIRKDDCDCTILFRSEGEMKEKLLKGGCCKFPLKVNLEEGGDNLVEIVFLTPGEINIYTKAIPMAQNPNAAFDTAHMLYPQDVANSYAHEIGHMMGLPDEYDKGTEASDKSLFPIANNSIMGGSMTRAYIRHMNYPPLFLEWINANVTNVKVIERK
jgi:hypothetical protein